MADEEDPWGFGGDDEKVETPAAGTAPGTGAGTAAGTAPASVGGSAGGPSTPAPPTPGQEAGEGGEPADDAETGAAPPPPVEDDGYRKPVQLYKHWVRPKFLQYKYMYNYRTNYYDDVIDYLDKKQSGIQREIPRPQTWAERVLRTNYPVGSCLDSYGSSSKRDKHLIQTLASSIRTHNYHTKAYINQKYAHVL